MKPFLDEGKMIGVGRWEQLKESWNKAEDAAVKNQEM